MGISYHMRHTQAMNRYLIYLFYDNCLKDEKDQVLKSLIWTRQVNNFCINFESFKESDIEIINFNIKIENITIFKTLKYFQRLSMPLCHIWLTESVCYSFSPWP